MLLYLSLLTSAQAAPIRVAVEQGPSSTSTGAGVVDQLNDDTYFDFTATLVTADQIDSADELEAYDVVVFGDSGNRNHDWTEAMATALETWVDAGRGGVVSTGWADYAIVDGIAGGEALDEIMPIDAYPDSVNHFCSPPDQQLVISSTPHPVTDGLSTTLMSGEIATDLGDKDIRTVPSLENGWTGGLLDDVQTCRSQIDPERPRFWEARGAVQLSSIRGQGRGYRWADAMPLMTGFNTVLPPNTQLCFGGDSTTIGTLSLSSRHQGGGHVAMGDGAVVFLTDSIESGEMKGSVTLDGQGHLAPGSPSPFGLWGALGTRNQNEMIGESL